MHYTGSCLLRGQFLLLRFGSMQQGSQVIIVGAVLLFSVLGGLFAAGLWGGNIFPYTPADVALHKIFVGGVPLSVDVARTQEQHERGLSGREFLAYNRGMLFVFDTQARYRIWMKDMLIPIDVFWLSNDGIITDIWEEAQPESYPFVYEPTHDARYILEAPAGFARVYNIKPGVEVTGLPEIFLVQDSTKY